MAVSVDNVFYSYGRSKSAKHVLNGIGFEIPEGNIYSILGPSGCGKTTLINCIVGILKPNKGSVQVFGQSPGSKEAQIPGPAVGYMPQQIGLFAEFTITETLTFFGKLNRLKQSVIKDRIRLLLELLDLPEADSRIANLSGGQKRRVSLASALVHKPPLLVLDEPTVGIDPVLRQSIWKHLKSWAKEGITVIITTHYVEEARSAHLVAFMRQGMLLEEDNPEVLIRRMAVLNLEEVFLKLCNKNNTDNSICDKNKNWCQTKAEKDLNDFKVIILDNDNVQKAKTSKTLIKNNLVNAPRNQTLIGHRFTRSEALFKKNWIRMYRNLPALIFTIIVPAFQCLFFLCLGRDPYEIPVAVFNEEPNSILSTQFLKHINNHTIVQNLYHSFDIAYESVRDGHNRALIAVGANFTRALMERWTHGYDTDEEMIEMSKVKLYLDTTSQFSANKIQQTIFESYQLFAKELLHQNGYPESIADPIIELQVPILGRPEPPVIQFMAPGFISSLSFFCAIATAALTLVLERKDGLLERSLVSGVRPNEYILSHVFTQIMVVIFQTLSVLMIAFLIFDIPIYGSIFLVSVLIVLQGVCGMAYGILISAITKEENFTLILCMGSMFPQFLLSGVVWPVETMPRVLQIISGLFSQAKSIEAVRYILYRGWGLQHFEVLLGFIIPSSWTIVFLLVAAIMFNVNKS